MSTARSASSAVWSVANLRGVAESARVLMPPTLMFIISIGGIVVLGLLRDHPAAVVGDAQPVPITEALGLPLILKAFSSGCSALTGVEATPTPCPPSANRGSGGRSAPS
ncbi:hypothetical protein [Streptomyces dangxiongensis]|uniref:hypothetical protein n=1 Tax=Streptomyces dangxiongensis TaxID=1442032 RepID=UPI001969B999|nr:hypothetical protein [Streptomyces dangxiongensis]